MDWLTVRSCLHSFYIHNWIEKHASPTGLQIVSNVLVLINNDKIWICPCNLPNSNKVMWDAHALPDLHKRHFSSEQDIANYSKCTLQKHKPLIEAGYQGENQDRIRLPSNQPNCIVFPCRILLAKSSGKGWMNDEPLIGVKYWLISPFKCGYHYSLYVEYWKEVFVKYNTLQITYL